MILKNPKTRALTQRRLWVSLLFSPIALSIASTTVNG